MLTLNKHRLRVVARTTLLLLIEYVVMGVLYWYFVVSADLGPGSRAICDLVVAYTQVAITLLATFYVVHHD